MQFFVFIIDILEKLMGTKNRVKSEDE